MCILHHKRWPCNREGAIAKHALIHWEMATHLFSGSLDTFYLLHHNSLLYMFQNCSEWSIPKQQSEFGSRHAPLQHKPNHQKHRLPASGLSNWTKALGGLKRIITQLETRTPHGSTWEHLALQWPVHLEMEPSKIHATNGYSNLTCSYFFRFPNGDALWNQLQYQLKLISSKGQGQGCVRKIPCGMFQTFGAAFHEEDPLRV